MQDNSIYKQLKSNLTNNNIYQNISKPIMKLACLDVIASNLENVRCLTHPLGLSDHETTQNIKVNFESVSNCKLK